MAASKPAIIVISSHVVRGTVGNRAAAFALEVLGHPVWAVPTVTLPWHPGHTKRAGAGERILASDDAFATLLEQAGNSPWIGEVGGILSGYLGSAAQAVSVAKLVRAVKKANPDALYALDPVIGDEGRLYVPEQQAEAIRGQLLPLADIVTPNRFELGWLGGTASTQDNGEAAEAAKALKRPMVLVTSSDGTAPDRIGNMLVSEEAELLADHERLPNPPNGLGDLTAALFLAQIVQGMPAEEALGMTTSSVFGAMAITHQAKADELLLERAITDLREPHAPIEMQRLG